MKKAVYFLLASVLVFSLCACGKSTPATTDAPSTPADAQVKAIVPSEVLTTENVASEVSYTPVSEEENSRLKQSVLYHSDPIGQGDVVKVEIVQQNVKVSLDEVRAGFDEAKEKRPKAEDVEISGFEAFIAYPSIHLYHEGYHITITAGSGAEEEQKELLIRLAKTAAENIAGMKNK